MHVASGECAFSINVQFVLGPPPIVKGQLAAASRMFRVK